MPKNSNSIIKYCTILYLRFSFGVYETYNNKNNKDLKKNDIQENILDNEIQQTSVEE